MTYALSIERRVMTGLSLLLRYEGRTANDYHFSIEFDQLGLDPTLTMNACRLKEGDWLVLNVADPTLSAARIKNGRLAVIKSIEDGWIDLDLLQLTFYNSSFRYPHTRDLEPAPGDLYVLDQMADDLNADKIIQSLAHVDSNAFYQWLLSRPLGREVTQRGHRAVHMFTDLVDVLERIRRPTDRQR